MVHRLQLPPAGRLHREARLGEGLEHLRWQVWPHSSPEGLGHLVRQLRQAARLAVAGIPVAEELGQQGLMDVGPPGQPGAVHLGGHQHPGRLGRGQQAHPVRMFRGVVPAQLLRINLEESLERNRLRL